MTTVMTDDQYAERLFINEAKQDRVWETMHETATNTVLDNGILEGVCTNARNSGIYLRSKLITEASTLLVVVLRSDTVSG
ncbi:MAG: hypothetical protein U1F76_27645 [Candidatus Competibacteraceae bacterium]